MNNGSMHPFFWTLLSDFENIVMIFIIRMNDENNDYIFKIRKKGSHKWVHLAFSGEMHPLKEAIFCKRDLHF